MEERDALICERINAVHDIRFALMTRTACQCPIASFIRPALGSRDNMITLKGHVEEEVGSEPLWCDAIGATGIALPNLRSSIAFLSHLRNKAGADFREVKLCSRLCSVGNWESSIRSFP